MKTFLTLENSINQEIKFRARGGDVLKYFVYFGIFDQTEDYVIDSQVQNDGSHHILQKNDIESVDRCTGTLDKNGKEIYQRDIVVYAEINLPVAIGFEDGGYCVKLCGPSHSGFDWLCTMRPEDIEIIGNVHENSDLLV